MENNKKSNYFKIDGQICFLNNGKYGYYLKYNNINYKVPDWYSVDSLNEIQIKKIIEYKNNWLLKKQKNESVAVC